MRLSNTLLLSISLIGLLLMTLLAMDSRSRVTVDQAVLKIQPIAVLLESKNRQLTVALSLQGIGFGFEQESWKAMPSNKSHRMIPRIHSENFRFGHAVGLEIPYRFILVMILIFLAGQLAWIQRRIHDRPPLDHRV